MNHEMPYISPKSGGFYILIPRPIGGTRGSLWGLGAGGVGGRKFYSCRRSKEYADRLEVFPF
jgi:hypothetical protein